MTQGGGGMDRAYLSRHLATLITHQRIRETPVSGGSICVAQRLTLDDGTSLFAKSRPDAPAGFFAAEAAGLRWLAEPDGPPVPEIIAQNDNLLALEWLPPGEPTAGAAERFGRELARLHRSGAPSFGAEWSGFLGALPMDNTPSAGPWPEWFAERRIQPYLRLSADSGALSGTDVARVEATIQSIRRYGGAEPPTRTHGDLWPGNVHWSDGGRAYLIDPAAHGAHRETDLAQLSLWGGVPFLDRLLDAYREVHPFTDGRLERVPLHQLPILLAHTAMFGAGFRPQVLAAVTALGH